MKNDSVVENPKQVFDQLESLGSRVANLENLICDLNRRLCEVTHPAVDKKTVYAEAELSKEGSELVPLAFEIQRLRLRLSNLVDDVEDILVRLEL